MSNVYKAPQGGFCKFSVSFKPPTPAGLPIGFSVYAEYQHMNGGAAITSREKTEQTIHGNKVYVEFDIPAEAPLGLYQARRAEMRVDQMGQRRTKEINLNEFSLPEIEVESPQESEFDWPMLERST